MAGICSTTCIRSACELNFNQDTYLRTGDAALPLVKLKGMHANVKVRKTNDCVGVCFRDLFEMIFASVTGGDSYFIDPQGRVSRKAQ